MAMIDLIAREARSNPFHLLTVIRAFLADFLRVAFNSYHPEQHYMRGPGPACAAKRAASRFQSR